MTKPPIFLDYDDVLVDFVSPILDAINRWEGTDLKPYDIPTYSYLPDTYGAKVRDLWENRGFYKYVKPFSTSKWFLDQLKEKYEIFIITRSHPDIVGEKEYHAKLHFGIRENFISVHGHKYPHTVGGPLIDDATHNIEDHIINNSQPGILFNMNGQNGWSKPTMSHYLLRIANSHSGALKLLGL